MTESARPPWAERLRAERKARGWSQSEMARQLHKAVGQQYPSVESLTRQIRGWEKGDHFPEPHWRRGYALALAINEIDLFGVGTSVSQSQEAGEIVLSLTAEATDLAIWAEQTNVGNMTIGILSDSTRRLVADYSHQPPVPVLRNALGLYRRTRDLIRGGHQHLGQTRDLYVVAGQLLAFLSWASSDLGQPAAADTYARSGWVMAEQADHNGLRAMVLVAQSKNAFWENHLHEAADYARRGLECAPTTSRRVLLACQLGDAYQALGDLTRAREAQELAARARDAITAPDDIGGVWACGPARQANYAIWVHLRAGDIREALADAEAADRAYAEGDEWAYGTWAQIHIGTANAHLLAGRVDGAAAALSPILGMRAEERLATLSARLGEVASQLGDQRYSGSPGARSLREEITDYRANAIRTRALPSGDQ